MQFSRTVGEDTKRKLNWICNAMWQGHSIDVCARVSPLKILSGHGMHNLIPTQLWLITLEQRLKMRHLLLLRLSKRPEG